MRVSVKTNFAPLATTPLSTKALMHEIGLLARERILRRTISGQSETGGAFAPYSPGYATRKAKAVGAGGVNLQLSGAMLNAIVILEETETSVTLGFSR